MADSIDDPVQVGPQVVFALDLEGTCTLSVGPGLAGLGLQPGELVGQNLYAYFADDPESGVRLRRVLSGETFAVEGRMGSRSLWTYFEPVRDARGTVTGALGVSTDVTRQREDREQLVKFQALADASEDLIAIADPDGRATYVNPRVRESGLEVDARDLWRTVADHVDETEVADVRASLAAGRRWAEDVLLRLPGGARWVNVAVFGLTHPSTGANLGTAWIAHDVTELRRTENALRAANADLEQFKALVETSPDFIAIADLDGTVRYVNPHGRELVGLAPGTDVATTTITDYLTPEGIEASLHVEQPAVRQHGHWEGESTLRNLRGPATPVAIASFLMHDIHTGEPFGLATVQRDISERLASEAALRTLAEQREALLTRLVSAQDAERAQIAADVHDDPVQALAALDLRLGLLRQRLEARAPDLLPVLDDARDSVAGASERLRSLLFDLEPPDLGAGLAGALRRAADELFSSTGTVVTVHGEQEPPAPEVTRAVAYRVAKEALINVRKHASATRVVVSVDGCDGWVCVRVEDDGRGLGPRPDPTGSPSPGHRGLATMRDRAALAGGRWEIADRPGGGTVVTVSLPGTVPSS
jgi:PAS domain S-box-containing protein